MFGKPKDIEGQCNAHLHIPDEHGDNSATIRCHLPVGHDGNHFEEYVSCRDGWVKISWEKNERPECCEGYLYEPSTENNRNAVEQGVGRVDVLDPLAVRAAYESR